MLEWSSWRRWHQARAGQYHNRRRERAREEQQSGNESEGGEWVELEQEVREVWERLEAVLGRERRRGRRYGVDRRVIVEAVVYVMRSGCGWEHLPKGYPGWKTVHSQLMDWQKRGIWQQIWPDSNQTRLEEQLQL